VSEDVGVPSDHYGLEGVASLASAYGGTDGPVRFNGNGESRSAHFNAGSGGHAQNQRRAQRPVTNPPASTATPLKVAAHGMNAAFKIGGL
jgi:hypothetical protein